MPHQKGFIMNKRRFINTMLLMVVSFLAGALAITVIDISIGVASMRLDGRFGGEVLIIPLIIILLYVGYLIAKTYFFEIVAERIYRKGYKKGVKDTINN